jgi:hypothetical protein
MSGAGRYDGRHIHCTHFGPMAFKPVNKPPVKGGRWAIRKVKFKQDGKFWHAYNKGRARQYTRYFNTHEEAIEYAQMIAQMYASAKRPWVVEQTLRTLNPQWSDETIERKVRKIVNPHAARLREEWP